MLEARQHTFQILTKRPERMPDVVSKYFGSEQPAEHIWLGTSIENRRFVWRADALRVTRAALRFVSAEPLLGPIHREIDLTAIDWLIVGGESGQKHRP
jgi:protein gp37